LTWFFGFFCQLQALVGLNQGGQDRMGHLCQWMLGSAGVDTNLAALGVQTTFKYGCSSFLLGILSPPSLAWEFPLHFASIDAPVSCVSSSWRRIITSGISPCGVAKKQIPPVAQVRCILYPVMLRPVLLIQSFQKESIHLVFFFLIFMLTRPFIF
jgi:hypothetical protein